VGYKPFSGFSLAALDKAVAIVVAQDSTEPSAYKGGRLPWEGQGVKPMPMCAFTVLLIAASAARVT